MSRRKTMKVDISKARSVLSYDENTGQFTWLVRQGRCAANTRAGSTKKAKYSEYYYRTVQCFGVEMREHRLAWAFVHGRFPDDDLDVDHINGDATDNRIANLRLATRSQNMGNAKRPSSNTSGVKGVFWESRFNKWLVQLTKDKKQHYLGLYESQEEAQRVAVAAHKRLHGEFSYEARGELFNA